MAIFVYKDEIISLKELLKRWENCSFGGRSSITVEEIDLLLRTGLLTAYEIRKFIPDNDKMSVKLVTVPRYSGTGHYRVDYNMVFLFDKIKELERNIEGKINTSEDFTSDSNSTDKNIDEFFASFPICQELYKLFLEGKSRAEMVIDLTSRNLATNLQAGWLTKTDKRYQSDDALKKEVGRLKTPKKAE